MKRKFHLIAGIHAGEAYPIGVDGKTLAEANSALNWQTGPGGFPPGDYRICFPHSFVRGVMVCKGTGEQFRMTRGAITEKAFTEMLDEIWG